MREERRAGTALTPEILQEIVTKWDEFYADPEGHDPAIERRILDKLLRRPGPMAPEDAIHVAAIAKFLNEHGGGVVAPLATPPRRLAATPTTEDETLEEDTFLPRRLVATAGVLDQIGMPERADEFEVATNRLLEMLLQEKLRVMDAAVRGHDKLSERAEELHGLARSAPSFDLVRQIERLIERAHATRLKHAFQFHRGPRGGMQPADSVGGVSRSDIVLDY